MLSRNLIFISLLILLSDNCYSQSFSNGWIQQNSGTTVNLKSVKFYNSHTGWCAGDVGKILKSTNSGVNWFAVKSGTVKNIKSFSFSSFDIGFAVGDSGLILKTTDSGNSWDNSDFPNHNYNFNSVFFVNDSVGFIGGESFDFDVMNKIFKTSNQGKTWDSLSSMSDFVKVIYFVSPDIGWIISITGTLGTESIYKTINGGINWFYQFNILNIYTVFFINQLTGWLSGYGSGPAIYKSTNGGNNWIPCTLCGLLPSHSLYFIDSIKGWGASLGLIYHTSNAGTNWTVQTTSHPLIQYNSIYFTDSLTGWVVGDCGVILKTTTGGVLTGITNTSAEIPEKYFLSQNYPNPFNPNTIINFQCSMFNFISLRVFDVLGNEVATLVNEIKQPGSYQIEFDGSNYPSGVYLYRLEIDGNVVDTKRMVLLK